MPERADVMQELRESNPQIVNQKWPDTDGRYYADRVLAGGRPDGEKVFAGHGYIEFGAGDIVVPEGTSISFCVQHGDQLPGLNGLTVERGVYPGGYSETFHAGDRIPNYTLAPPVSSAPVVSVCSRTRRPLPKGSSWESCWSQDDLTCEEPCMDVTEERHWVLTDVSLVIKGRDLHPEEITPFLDIGPTGVRNPGPSKWGRPGEIDGQWRISCDERTSRNFHEQLDSILSTAERKRTELRQLAEQGYEVTVSLLGFSGNESTLALQPEEIKRIAILGFPLTVAASMNER
ncbi:DUF4279 domain-containing protein [Streptomyces aurantiogriseus]|nr:DUF4279 domain-containing protein [Streptomyces aurantiogriseus]